MIKITKLFKTTGNYSDSRKISKNYFQKVHAMEIKAEKYTGFYFNSFHFDFILKVLS